MPRCPRKTVGIIGGARPQGKGLGYRFARGGHDVVLGSRQEDRAVAAVEELGERLGAQAAVRGMETTRRLRQPISPSWPLAHRPRRRGRLVGHTVISCVDPLGFDRHGPYRLGIEGSSAAGRAAALLPKSDLVADFHCLSAVSLLGDSD